ncbi:MAG: hypothetical protein R6W78_06080 [Bacteroidales bacterium]
MFGKTFKISVTFLLTVIFYQSNCAERTDTIPLKRHDKVFSVTLLGPTYFYSFNHMWTIKENNRSRLFYQMRMEFFQYRDQYHYDNYTIEKDKYFIIGSEIIKQFGIKNSHFHLGMGHSYFINREISRTINQSVSSNDYFGNLFLDIGYCYWNPSKRFYAKIALTPIIRYPDIRFTDKQYDRVVPDYFLPWFGLSFGYAYSRGLQLSYLKNLNKQDNSNWKINADYHFAFGYSTIRLNNYGKGRGIALSNNLSCNFTLKHLIFSLNLAHKISGINKVSSDEFGEFRVFSKAPEFWKLGFGTGYEFIADNGWYFCPEFIIGRYLNEKIEYFIKPLTEAEYELADNFDYNESNSINYACYMNLRFKIKKELSPRFFAVTGAEYNAGGVLNYKDYSFILGLDYIIK